MPPRVIMAIAVVGTMLPTAVAEARQQVIDWTAPRGGLFTNPANWSPRSIPGSSDLARFDLDAAYLVQGPSDVGLGQLVIGESDLRWRQGDGEPMASGLSVQRIRVGNGSFDKPRRLAAPGRLRLDGGLDVFTDQILLGDGSLASQLVIGPDVRVLSQDLLGTPAASLGIALGGDREASVPRLFIVGGSPGLGEFQGSLVVAASESGPGNPPPAGRQSLVASKAGIPPESFPFVVSRPPEGRSLTFKIGTSRFGTELVADVNLADSIVEFVPTESIDVSASPTRITAVDLDADGRDDLVALFGIGKIAVFRGLGDGDFGPLTAYPVDGVAIDVATGDFDRDGTVDLAVGSRVDAESGVLQFLLNPANDPSSLEAGPGAAIAGEVRSLATTAVVLGQAFASYKGVTVSASSPSGAGRATTYAIQESAVETIAEIEIGDEPGPSDPIEDENKKDPDPPIGVAGESSAAATRGGSVTPVLEVLQPTLQGFQRLRTIPLTGRAVDFVSAYLGDDPWIDCLVITDTGHLDLVRPTTDDLPTRSIPLDGTPTSIALGDVDGDGVREIIIGLAAPPRIEVLRSLPDTLFPAKPLAGRVILEQVLNQPIDQNPRAIAATDQGSLAIGLDEGDGPSIRIGQADVTSIPGCVRVDFNGDGTVDSSDLGVILQDWGPCGGCAGDLDGNGLVNAADLGILFAEWGPCG